MGFSIKWLLVASLGLGAGGFLVFEGNQAPLSRATTSANGLPLERVKNGDRTFDLEVAATQAAVVAPTRALPRNSRRFMARASHGCGLGVSLAQGRAARRSTRRGRWIVRE